MLCAEEATQLAQLWIQENPELPLTCRLCVKRYRPKRRYREFSVLWDVPNLHNVMLLMHIAVHDDALVTVRCDYRHQVEKLKLIGFIREHRLFSVLEGLDDAPEWLVGVRRSDIGEDMRGIDGFADITKKSSQTTLEIPFQVKSSLRGEEMHFAKYAHHQGAVASIVVEDHLTDDELRWRFYDQITLLHERYVQGRLRLKKTSLKAAR